MQSDPEPEIITMQYFNCLQILIPGCKSHYKFILGSTLKISESDLNHFN